jgi:hypothetical protein
MSIGLCISGVAMWAPRYVTYYVNRFMVHVSSCGIINLNRNATLTNVDMQNCVVPMRKQFTVFARRSYAVLTCQLHVQASSCGEAQL